MNNLKETTKLSKKGDPVQIIWIDSISSDGWHDYIPANMVCTTIGHYYAEYLDRIVIALNRALQGGYGSYIEIPKTAVKKVKWL